MSLLLTLNVFHTFFYCFYCWFWISKCLLGYMIQSTSLINQMVISQGDNSHRVAVWSLQAMRLKIRVSHLTWKVANKGLSVWERVEVVERNEYGPLSSPAVPWFVSIRERKTLIEKKSLFSFLWHSKNFTNDLLK